MVNRSKYAPVPTRILKLCNKEIPSHDSFQISITSYFSRLPLLFGKTFSNFRYFGPQCSSIFFKFLIQVALVSLLERKSSVSSVKSLNPGLYEFIAMFMYNFDLAELIK